MNTKLSRRQQLGADIIALIDAYLGSEAHTLIISHAPDLILEVHDSDFGNVMTDIVYDLKVILEEGNVIVLANETKVQSIIDALNAWHQGDDSTRLVSETTIRKMCEKI